MRRGGAARPASAQDIRIDRAEQHRFWSVARADAGQSSDVICATPV
jgi:hypothetical protein